MLNITVILPERYRGGTLRGALNIAKMLKIGAAANDQELALSFGYVDDPDIYSDDDFIEIKQLGIRPRPFRLEHVGAKSLDTILFKWLCKKNDNFKANAYTVFNDGVSNFEESDFWVIVSDRLSFPIPPHRNYAVVVYDYIQRYVPDIFGLDGASNGNWMHFEQYAKAARDANFVICTTEQTRKDCINYVGAESEKVIKFPQEFDPISHVGKIINFEKSKKKTKPYILWTTNSTQHKNHINIVKGLELFFTNNPNSNIDVHMSGVYTHLFHSGGANDVHFNDSYAVKVRSEIQRSSNLKKRLKILGNIPDVEYKKQLSEAEWLLHGALYDNGTFSIIEAAWVGVPVISSDYPAIRECCDNFSLDIVLFDANSYVDLARVLEENLAKRKQCIEKIPSKELLVKNSFENVAPKYWRLFYENYLKYGANNEK